MEELNCTYCGHEVEHDMDVDPDDPVFCSNDCEISYWKDRAETAEAELEKEREAHDYDVRNPGNSGGM